MAGSRAIEEMMQMSTPNTLAALKNLVMAMADVASHAGKKSFFGKDKGAAAYAKFVKVFTSTLFALERDGRVDEKTAPDRVIAELEHALETFALAFPNWQDEQAFGVYFMQGPGHPHAMELVNTFLRSLGAFNISEIPNIASPD